MNNQLSGTIPAALSGVQYLCVARAGRQGGLCSGPRVCVGQSVPCPLTDSLWSLGSWVDSSLPALIPSNTSNATNASTAPYVNSCALRPGGGGGGGGGGGRKVVFILAALGYMMHARMKNSEQHPALSFSEQYMGNQRDSFQGSSPAFEPRRSSNSAPQRHGFDNQQQQQQPRNSLRSSVGRPSEGRQSLRLSVEARVVIASVETYLKYAEAIGLTSTAASPA